MMMMTILMTAQCRCDVPPVPICLTLSNGLLLQLFFEDKPPALPASASRAQDYLQIFSRRLVVMMKMLIHDDFGQY